MAALISSLTPWMTLLWLQYQVLWTASEKVYLDKYGHCSKVEPFDLNEDDYTIKPFGGGFAHEALVCHVTFKAPPKSGVCLNFEEFEIDDCVVRLNIYRSSPPLGSPWRTLGCTDSYPSRICSSERFLTVEVAKDKLNGNRGYDFEIQVNHSSSITEEGVLFLSIGVLVAVIAGAVVLTALVAFLIRRCCCKQGRRNGGATAEKQQADPEAQEGFVQPTAPPMAEADGAEYDPHHIYPQLLPQGDTSTHPHEPPPPYQPPPPYESENH